jgi:hypothetical protein
LDIRDRELDIRDREFDVRDREFGVWKGRLADGGTNAQFPVGEACAIQLIGQARDLAVA